MTKTLTIRVTTATAPHWEVVEFDEISLRAVRLGTHETYELRLSTPR